MCRRGSGLRCDQTWEYDGIVLFDAEFGQVLDVSTGQSGALHQHVPLLLRRFAFHVIHHVHLVDVGGEHVDLRWIKQSQEHPSASCRTTQLRQRDQRRWSSIRTATFLADRDFNDVDMSERHSEYNRYNHTHEMPTNVQARIR